MQTWYPVLRTLCTLLAVVGALVMARTIIHYNQFAHYVAQDKRKTTRLSWLRVQMIRLAMVFFVIGYIVGIIDLLTREVEPIFLFVVVVFFVGSLFISIIIEQMQKMAYSMQNHTTEAMLDATPLCCALWNKDLKMIDCNNEAVKIFELSSQEEFLKRFLELAPVNQPDGSTSVTFWRQQIRAALKSGYERFEWVLQKFNGELVPVEITMVRVECGGEELIASYARDLREAKRAMEEIKRTEEALRVARDQAEESARSKSEFLANMSHEIRTPMNAVLGTTTILLGTELTEKQRMYLERNQQSAILLLRIINDILDFSKIEAGRLEMESNPLSLGKLFSELKDYFEEKTREKGIEFIVEPVTFPDAFLGDTLRLNQVLLNLCSNAVKFTSKGSVRVRVIERKRTEKQAILQFSVTDTGIGLGLEEIHRLFRPFSQADASTTRKYGGTGLGLAISKSIVSLMKGEIWCDSELGRGSTFSFTACFAINNAVTPTVEEQKKVAASAAEMDAKLSGARILLAEDNEINQLVAVELLQSRGCIVDVANNGLEAVEKVQTAEYDAVLMDIQMPEMDGIDATRKIRANSNFDKLPIIAMTAHAMCGDKEKSLEAGMNDHVTKPIEIAALYSTLVKFLSEK